MFVEETQSSDALSDVQIVLAEVFFFKKKVMNVIVVSSD